MPGFRPQTKAVQIDLKAMGVLSDELILLNILTSSTYDRHTVFM